jgi:hypothetical protein
MEGKEMWYESKRITVMDIVLIALFTALQFVLSIFIQASAAVHPAFPPVMASLLIGFLFVFLGLLVRKVGCQLLFGFAHGFLLALSPAITLGPHWIKILSGILPGLVFEAVLLLMRRRERGAALLLGAVVGPTLFLGMLGTIAAVVHLTPIGDPELQQKLTGMLGDVIRGTAPACLAAAVVGLGTGYLAWNFFNSIRNTGLVRRLQSWR